MITTLICVLLGILIGFTLGCAFEYVVDHIEKKE